MAIALPVLLAFLLAAPIGAEPSQPELLTTLTRPGRSTLHTTLHAAPGGHVLLERPDSRAFLTTNGQTPINLGEASAVIGAHICPDARRRFVPFAGELYYQLEGFVGPDLATFLARTDGLTSEVLLFDSELGSPFCIHDLTASGSSLFFVVEPADGNIDSELWKTDGTPAGSGPVATGFGPRQLTQLTDADGTLFFSVGNPNAGPTQLWKSDGTAAGTVLVSGGFATNAIAGLTAAGPRVFFSGDDGVGGAEPWVSDGTPAGTLPLAVRPGAGGSDPDSFVALGPGASGCVFVADDGVTGPEPWFSDGTILGTVRLADIQAGAAGSDPAGLAPYGNQVVFAADDASGREPWITDGTPAGTRRLADLRPGVQGSDPQGFTEVSGRLFFSANDGLHGAELHSSDGTTAGTLLERDIYVGPLGANPSELTESGGSLYFTAFEPFLGLELYSHDAGQTGLLWDTAPGRAGVSPVITVLTRLGERLLFTAITPEGQKLHVTDGTPEGTTAVDPLGADGPLNAIGFAPAAAILGNRAFYRGVTPGSGSELFATDGTAAGTSLVKDIVPGPDSGSPEEFATADGFILFVAAGPGIGRELWRTDGTEGGTQLVLDVRPGSTGSLPRSPVWAGTLGFFDADDGVHGREMWVTDGTPAGTRLLRDIAPNLGGLQVTGRAVLDPHFYFTTTSGPGGGGLWQTDGTEVGTVQLLEADDARSLVVFDGRVFFKADTAETGAELFVSDGTPEGTGPLVDLAPGPEDGLNLFTAGPIVAGDQIFFIAGSLFSDRQLWRTDGTAAGTRPVIPDILPTSTVLRDANGRLIFQTSSGGVATVWHSDGTPEGTAPFAMLPNAQLHDLAGDRLIVSFGPNITGIIERVPHFVKLDTDDDDVFDEDDNCTRVENPGQEDIDASVDDDTSLVGLQSYGDACDADLDNDGHVGPSDFFSIFRPCLGADVALEPACARADLTGDGVIGPADFFGRMRPAFGKPPGPGLGD